MYRSARPVLKDFFDGLLNVLCQYKCPKYLPGETYVSKINTETDYKYNLTTSNLKNDDFLLKLLKSATVGVVGRLYKNPKGINYCGAI